MASNDEWLAAQLDSRTRREIADLIETRVRDEDGEATRLLKVLRSSRDDLLLSRAQAGLVLKALNVDRSLPSLRARLEAFLGLR
jgi:hypothetical protein